MPACVSTNPPPFFPRLCRPPVPGDSCHATAGYQFPDNFNVQEPTDDAGFGIKSITKNSMSTAIGGEIQLVQLASDPSPSAGGTAGANAAAAATMLEVEKWIIYNPLITSVDFDSLDYSSEELLNIKVGITYDWAKLDSIDAARTFSIQAPSLTGFGSDTGSEG